MNKHILLIYVWSLSGFLLAQGPLLWEPPVSIATSAAGNNHPRIVTDASGQPLVIWYNARQVMLSRGNGTGFEPPVRLNPTDAAGASWMGPDIASHGDTIYVVYKELPEDLGHVMLVSSFDGGQSFHDPVRVDSIGNDLSRFPTVTTDDEGHPIIAFMKFSSGFSDARWVVTRSFDWGLTFSPDALASGWSSPDADVCDCCPGAVVSAGSTVIMLYRDNHHNIRDTWAGVSDDGGLSFGFGANIDQHNWMISACPSTGPDGAVIGDSLYSTFMSSASGMAKVYANVTSLTNFSPGVAPLLTGTLPGISQQNFPRVDAEDNALAMVWRQVAGSQQQCVMAFATQMDNGSQMLFDTVHIGNVANTDVALGKNKVYVVWQDDSSGTVKFRSASYSGTTALAESLPTGLPELWIQYQSGVWNLQGHALRNGGILEILDLNGQHVGVRWNIPAGSETVPNIPHDHLPSGIYVLLFGTSGRQYALKAMK